MRIFSAILIFLSFPLFVFALDSGDAVEMGVSPLKFELTTPPGQSTVRMITFYNNSDKTYDIFLSAEDCVADNKAGTPKCRVMSSSGVDPSSLATWIVFQDTGRISIPPNSERKINFSINPPIGAVPGGHYGAISLSNIDAVAEGGNTVKMIRRALVLLLVNIPGKLIYDTKIGNIEIDVPVLNAPSDPSKKSLPKWKLWMDKIVEELDPRVTTPMLVDTGDFTVTFVIPVNNNGNIHILPVGRVELYDENEILLKYVGKETIRTPEGVFLGEKIVDYLPINDETSNVLPGSDRIFTVFWKGFAYNTVEGGKSVIKFLTPQQYFSKTDTENASMLLPWEKYRIKLVTKTIKAKIYLEYKGDGDVPIPYELEQNVTIKYYSVEKELNYGAIAILIFGIFVFWFVGFLRRREKRMDLLEAEVGYLEAEVDELEKGKILAKKVLEKKRARVALQKKISKEEETPLSNKKKIPPKSHSKKAE